MAVVELVMPKMGESVMEGTIIRWLKKPGDSISIDEPILEVATDKVDTEIPSSFSGVLKEILVAEGQIAQIGNIIALIETSANTPTLASPAITNPNVTSSSPAVQENNFQSVSTPVALAEKPLEGRFYSPLVMNIAKEEGISMSELERIPGTGKDSRVTKNDIIAYITSGRNQAAVGTTQQSIQSSVADIPFVPAVEPIKVLQENTETQLKPATSYSGPVDIIEMDRMRKMISQRMLDSRKISAHVSSFVEADVTNLVFWRNRMKQEFKTREDVNLTLTPIFIEAIARAIKDYPLINSSIDGDNIVVKKFINIGLAVALQNGNLIVPVIKNVDQLNLIGITKQVNDLAKRARENKLTPDELSDGTYTMSNVGSFGNVMGTPIIMQPQVAIMAFGAVQKKPAVIETPHGDAIAIRHMMYLSHSYDHRIVDGSLGGMFVRRVADYLENFDINRKLW